MRRDHALSEAENERVRDALRRIVTEAGGQKAAAERIGTSQQSVSRGVSGQPIGPEMARRVAATLIPRVSFEELLGRAPPLTRSEPRLSDLPGWAEAEVQARIDFRYIPEPAWIAVRGLRTAMPPRVVTSDWIGSLAQTWARVLTGEGDETAYWLAELEKERKK